GSRKGAATGVYNTTQSIGLALGGIVGGWLLKQGGPNVVFLTCAGAVAVWLAIAFGMKPPPART
ncbi:MFS transporter, partial [Burkholderia cepacia]